jgi:preprotein translocase subunit SecD
MFTAIVITRALLGLLSDRGIHLSPALMGVSKASISTTQQARVR